MRGLRLLLSALTVVLGVAVFLGSAKFLEELPMCQAGPAVLRMVFSFGSGVLAVVLTLAVITLLFGRLFCSFMCPLGSLLSFFALFSKKGRKKIYPIIGGSILGFFIGAMVFGLALVFRLLDPYSLFGRALTAPLWFGVIFFAAILVITLLFGRLFCTSFCPVGLLLSLIAKRSAFGITIPDDCVPCGKCENVCPTGCIDQKKNEVKRAYCVMCLDCLTVCPRTGPTYSFLWKKREEEEKTPDPERRRFLVSMAVGAALGLAGGGVFKLLSKKQLSNESEKKLLVRPPGAVSESSFLAKCTACGLCVSKCPQKVLALGPAGFGAPRLDFKRGACSIDCVTCSSVCPTGALRKIDPDRKKAFVIGKAIFTAKQCIAFQGGKCGKCASACPTAAITLRANGTPKLEAEKCLGCGGCQHVCPTGAMHVTGAPIQHYLDDLNQGVSL